jgi:hypothetical protein
MTLLRLQGDVPEREVPAMSLSHRSSHYWLWFLNASGEKLQD